jgi:hypothetical protein
MGRTVSFGRRVQSMLEVSEHPNAVGHGHGTRVNVTRRVCGSPDGSCAAARWKMLVSVKEDVDLRQAEPEVEVG